MAKQLSIFVENKPGRLEAITETLSKNNINVVVFNIQNRGDFGLVRFLVDNPQKAYLALADKGYACALKEVLLVSIPDKCGNLHKLTKLLFQHNVNISDIYGFVSQPNNLGVCCLEVEDLEKTKKLAEKEGFCVLEKPEFTNAGGRRGKTT